MQDFIYDEVGSDAIILEIGSGAGTHRLVELFCKVYTIEHSERWAKEIPKEATLLYSPLIPYEDKYYRDATYWYDHNILHNILPTDYNVIIVDGPKCNHGRGGFDTYFSLFKKDCLIVFDDVHRLWDFRLAGRVAQKLNKDLIIKTGKEGRRWFGVIKGEPK